MWGGVCVREGCVCVCVCERGMCVRERGVCLSGFIFMCVFMCACLVCVCVWGGVALCLW